MEENKVMNTEVTEAVVEEAAPQIAEEVATTMVRKELKPLTLGKALIFAGLVVGGTTLVVRTVSKKLADRKAKKEEVFDIEDEEVEDFEEVPEEESEDEA